MIDKTAAPKKLSDRQIMKLVDERQKLMVAKAQATQELRAKAIELQAQMDELARPFQGNIDKIEAVLTKAIIERGTVDGLNTGDVDIVYVSGYDRRSVDLDGFWNLQNTAPKLWEKLKAFARTTHIGPRVSFKS